MSGPKGDKSAAPAKADPDRLPSTEDFYDVGISNADVPQRDSVDHEDGGLAGVDRSAAGFIFASPSPHGEATPHTGSRPESSRGVHFVEVPMNDGADAGSAQDQPGGLLSLPRRASQFSLSSMVSGTAETPTTYFNASHPRDPTAQLAVQFQESAEAVRVRRAERRGELKLEPVKSITEGLVGARASIASFGSTFLRQKRKERRDDDFVDREVRTDAHQIALTTLETRLETNWETGLSHAEARARLMRDGPNQLTPPKGVSKWRLMARELLSPFALVLWGASILCFVAFGVTAIQDGSTQVPGTNSYENLIVGIALVLVVVITAVFSFVQTVKSSNVMAGFAKLAPQSCIVVREGEMVSIPPAELVVGDVVCVDGGDNVPADLRVVKCHNMKVDNSALTGESDPQARSVACTNDNPLETANLAFSGTSVVEGSGRGIVIHTGDATVIGQLAGLVSGVEQEATPLHKEINRFVLCITILAFVLAIIFTGAGLGRGDYWPSLLVVVIGIVVGTVPEGLPSAVAVSLALAAKRMAAKNVLVTEQLAVVETLGRTTVIASDKTGTLTQNKMTVSHVWCDDTMVDARQDVFDATLLLPKMLANENGSSFQSLYLVGALCSRAVFEGADSDSTGGSEDGEMVASVVGSGLAGKGKTESSPVSVDALDIKTPVSLRKVIGDASETAILRFCEELCTVSNARESHPKLAELPFNSTNKYQVSVHQVTGHPTADFVVVMKGAPERIIARCSSVSTHGAIRPLDTPMRDAFEEAYAYMGGMGERVLGFSLRFLDRADYPAGFEFTVDPLNIPIDDMVFLGLMSMIDPPRDSVPSALATCRKAGIKVAMVTGDHPNTAEAIAKKIGLLTPEAEKQKRSVVIHGDSLREMSDAELDLALTHDEIVFARTSPAQKLRIVEGFQRTGHIVAVTGDGVNDSPALKQANVGVAMGISGSDVSKDASDIILLDDNFGSIVNGVAEGRVIFDNLKKSIAYTLSSKFPQLLPYILSFFLRLPAPLNALLILSIDIGTDLLPAISLAYEQAEANVMKRPPRGNAHRDHLVNIPSIIYSYLFLGVIQCLAGFTSYFIMYSTGGGVQDGHFAFSQLWFGEGDDFMNSPLPNTDADGVVWTQSQRLQLAKVASTAYFATLLHVRVWVLFTCKTLERSLFKHGLFGNRLLLVGAFSVIMIPVVFSYVPGIQWVFNSAPLPWYAWFISLPYGAFLLAVDELRKYVVRTRRGTALGEALRY